MFYQHRRLYIPLLALLVPGCCFSSPSIVSRVTSRRETKRLIDLEGDYDVHVIVDGVPAEALEVAYLDGLEQAEKSGRDDRAAKIRDNLAQLNADRGDLDRGAQYAEASLEYYYEVGSEWQMSKLLRTLANIYFRQQRTEEYLEIAEYLAAKGCARRGQQQPRRPRLAECLAAELMGR